MARSTENHFSNSGPTEQVTYSWRIWGEKINKQEQDSKLWFEKELFEICYNCVLSSTWNVLAVDNHIALSDFVLLLSFHHFLSFLLFYHQYIAVGSSFTVACNICWKGSQWFHFQKSWVYKSICVCKDAYVNVNSYVRTHMHTYMYVNAYVYVCFPNLPLSVYRAVRQWGKIRTVLGMNSNLNKRKPKWHYITKLIVFFLIFKQFYDVHLKGDFSFRRVDIYISKMAAYFPSSCNALIWHCATTLLAV